MPLLELIAAACGEWKMRARLGAALLGFVTVFPAALSAGSVADMDRENGLPDAQIGAPVERFKNYIMLEEAGRWITYQQPGEKLEYKGFEIKDIKYNFFKGKLYSINVDVASKRSVRGILKALERDFGTDHTLQTRHPKEVDTDLEVREWTGAKTYVLYKSAEDGRGAELTILDKPIWDQMQVPRQEREDGFRKLLQGSYTSGDF